MDVNESAVLQGIKASRRTELLQGIEDGDGGEIPGIEKEFINQLFSVEAQRAWVDEMKAKLGGESLADLDEEDKAALRKRLSVEVGTLVLMEVRFKSLEKTLGDIQNRIKQIEAAGAAV